MFTMVVFASGIPQTRPQTAAMGLIETQVADPAII